MNYLKDLFVNDNENNAPANAPRSRNVGEKKMQSMDSSRKSVLTSVKEEPMTNAGNKETKEITFNDIHESITGCARIIKYQAIYGDCYSKDVSLLKVHCIEEGEFRAGKKHGYCRVMDGQENTVHFGMWKDDVKHGKFAEYEIDIPVTKN